VLFIAADIAFLRGFGIYLLLGGWFGGALFLHYLLIVLTIIAMNDFISLHTVVTIFTLTGGIVSLFQMLEYMNTKRIPWLVRRFQILWKTIVHRFKEPVLDDALYLILNFSGHPVLGGQLGAIEKMMHWPSSQVIDVPVGTISEDHGFVASIVKKIEAVDLLPAQWQTSNIVVIPAGYSALWSVVLAELHGRLGYFPDVVHLRPAAGSSKEKFEVAEVMNLRDVRHASRGKR